MNRHRAGHALLTAITVFLLAQLVLNLALETIRPEWRDPEYGWRLKALRTIERTRGNRPLILALGSSRTQMGLCPTSLGFDDRLHSPIVYNAGQAGSGPMQMLLNLRRYLDAGIRPCAVLVEILPSTLGQPGTVESQYHTQAIRLGGADLARLQPYCTHPMRLYDRWLAQRILPWHSLRFPLLSHWLPTLLPWQNRIDFQWRMMDPLGWTPFPFDEISLEDRARLTAETKLAYEARLQSWQLAALPDRALRDLLTLCREKNIAVALYRMPEGSMFRDWTTAETQDQVTKYVSGLKDSYDVPMFDASTWLPDEMFSDGHHIMKPGARKFSERFGREYLNEWVMSR